MGGESSLAAKSGSPPYTTEILLLMTMLGFTLRVATPPTSAAVPSVFSVAFFFPFDATSNVTMPVATPAPGATGWILASRPSETTFFFLKTGWGTNAIRVAAGLIVTAAVAEAIPGSSMPPRNVATIEWAPIVSVVVDNEAVPDASSATEARTEPPSVNVTLPTAVRLSDSVTLATKVTDCPKTAEPLDVESTIAGVGATMVKVWGVDWAVR